MSWDDEKDTFQDRPDVPPDQQLTAEEWNAHADDQKNHSGRHEQGGSDELSVEGLSGVLADAQTPQTEAVEDIVGALIQSDGNISVTYDDANDTLTIDTSALDEEEVEDAVAALITAGNAVTVNYDDANDTLSIAVDESALSFYDGTNLTAPVDNESVNTDNSHPKRSMQIRNAAEFDGATGGEQIQAAIDDLSSRGGLVFIPSEGPDTVDGESGVWEVASTIETTDAPVHLLGANPGWKSVDSGSTLKASVAVDPMVLLNTEYLEGITKLRIDGNDTAVDCVHLGQNKNNNDWQMFQCMVHSPTSHGVTLSGSVNFWITNCWIELCGGRGINIQCNDSIWISDLLTWSNEYDIAFDEAGVNLAFVSGVRSDAANSAVVGFLSDAQVISINDVVGDGTNGPVIEVNATAEDIVGRGIFGQGSNSVVETVSGEFVDSDLADIHGRNLTESKFVSTLGVSNSTRLVVNGVSDNGTGDPRSTGDWLDEGYEGLRVYWTDSGNRRIEEFVEGGWETMRWEVS